MQIKIFLMILIIMIWELNFAGKLRIVSTEEAPTNYTSNGEFIGSSVDIVNKIKENLGLEAPIEVFPWIRAYHILKNESNIMAFTAGKTEQREKLGFHFLGPLFTRKHILYKRKDSDLQINSISEIINEGLVIGCVRGDWCSDYFIEKGAKVDVVTEHKINVAKLLKGRIDLWALSDLEFGIITTEAGFSPEQFEPVFQFDEGQSYMLFANDTDKEILDMWTNEFHRLEELDYFDEIAEKWGKILKLNLEYRKKQGFIIR